MGFTLGEKVVKGVVKVPFDDVQKFANAVIELLRNKELREKLGKEGREFVKDLSWDKAAEIELKAIIS